MNVQEHCASRALRLTLCTTLVAVVGGWLAANSWAQRSSAPPAGGLTRIDVNRILRDKSYGADEQKFDAYFARWFAQFDAADKDPNVDLPALRAELRNYLRTGKNGPPHDKLNDMAFKKMSLLVRKSHIATRYTAMLILGELNKDNQPGKVAVPYDKAFFFLKTSVQKANFPDDLKIAGMIGIERYAAANAIPAADKAAIVSALLTLMRQEEPPPGRTLEGHTWLRRMAGQVLATVGAGAADPTVVEAMAAIIANPQARTSLRCDMAEHLGQMKYPPDAKIDYASLANLLCHQAVEICQPELAGGNTSASTEALAARRRRLLAYALTSTLRGLEGTNGIGGMVGALKANEKEKEKYDSVNKLRQSVVAICEALEKEEQFVVEDMKAKIDELRGSLVEKPAPKAAPPAEQKKEQTAELAKQPAAAQTARPAGGGN